MRCTVHPPRWAERCPSSSQPLLDAYTAARDHGGFRPGLLPSTHHHCCTFVGWICSAPLPFLPSPLPHSAPGGAFPPRQRKRCRAPAAGRVSWKRVRVKYITHFFWLNINTMSKIELIKSLNVVYTEISPNLLAQSARHRSCSCSTSASSSVCLTWQPDSSASRCSRPLFSLAVNSTSRSAASLRLRSAVIWLWRVWMERCRAAFSSSGLGCIFRSWKEPWGDQSPSTRLLPWARYLRQWLMSLLEHHFEKTILSSRWGYSCRTNLSGCRLSVVSVGCQSAVYLSPQPVPTSVCSGEGSLNKQAHLFVRALTSV